MASVLGSNIISRGDGPLSAMTLPVLINLMASPVELLLSMLSSIAYLTRLCGPLETLANFV
jgi:hypothetical protein